MATLFSKGYRNHWSLWESEDVSLCWPLPRLVYHSSGSLYSIVLGKLAGFIAMLIMAAVGIATIFIKQRGGLHNKRRDNGIFIYKNIFKR